MNLTAAAAQLATTATTTANVTTNATTTPAEHLAGVGIEVAVVIAAVALLQLKARRVRTERTGLGVVWLGLAALSLLGQTLPGHLIDPLAWVLVGGSLVLGVVAGALRGSFVKLSVEAGAVIRRGTAATVAIWLLALGVRVGMGRGLQMIDPALAAVSVASLVLYLVALAVTQRTVVHHRARQLMPTVRTGTAATA